MDHGEFRRYAHELVDWMADYLENVENYPVKSQSQPGEIYNKLPSSPPLQSEGMEHIFKDFKDTILPGITHWQSPNFFAYFPANASPPSILAEMLTATLGAQCMIWETSPAAAELEEKVMNWLKTMTGLPRDFEGCIQDTASTATLCAILSAREKASNFEINEKGATQSEPFRVYCSSETHSSIEKAVKIAGIGSANLIKIETDDSLRISPEKLDEAIAKDIEDGKKPICIVATLGTTSTTAIDPLEEIGSVAKKYGLWLHVDAAFSGTALILPECRWMIKGIEGVDSFVFNPHKWMFTNFDCSAYFVKDAAHLIRLFEILPEYLKTKSRGSVNDYRDWGVPLGRRFRALKLWFVIRSYGVEGLQKKLRNHFSIANALGTKIEAHPDFEILSEVRMPLVCFRWKPAGVEDHDTINRKNEALLQALNQSGKLFLTHTKIDGKYALRMTTAQTNVTKAHVLAAWDRIRETATALGTS